MTAFDLAPELFAAAALAPVRVFDTLTGTLVGGATSSDDSGVDVPVCRSGVFSLSVLLGAGAVGADAGVLIFRVVVAAGVAAAAARPLVVAMGAGNLDVVAALRPALVGGATLVSSSSSFGTTFFRLLVAVTGALATLSLGR